MSKKTDVSIFEILAAGLLGVALAALLFWQHIAAIL